ncbi:hypothetical protein AB6Q40_002897 [Salmonella enterica]|uniref:Uncharacterized protein n=1 Tax=Salmonella muenster TaxID=82689 RepID=A0A5U9HA17_SALMS|nr:hypothetical protein [Salmonella enterica subsp. enterica]EAB2332697.1 hypothetical protein [Salmonella enterica]EBJ5983066.1 hypothetical protein [Salmonella enterica subsp. enterica serovar Muenster]EIF4306089.1 hypothetical protein [Salmonella enterica subsp. enterica serovar Anatum]EAA8383748.1 hypothetical protein [Salmonella enterica subsp. enterica]
MWDIRWLRERARK